MTLRIRLDLSRFERDLQGALAVYDELPSAMQRRVLPPALLAWARVLRDAARKTSLFEDKTGILRRSIRAHRFRQRGGLPPGAFAAAGPFEPRHRAYHAHLVEFGHEGSSPAPPHPFMAEALRASESRAFAALVREFRARTARAGSDLIAKYGTR